MKSILKFEAVKKALGQVVAESDKSNGTNGMTLLCHYWSHEYQYDETRQTLMNEMGKLALLGKPDEIIKVRAQIEALPKPKIIMEFRLLKPIPMIRGTKTVIDGSKTYTISAQDVKSIFIQEDALHSDLGEFEETGETTKDAVGQDTPVIKLLIKKGLLDVAGESLDPRDRNKPTDQRRIVRQKRVYLTAVSYHTLQVVGRMQYREQNNRDRRYGMDEQS